MPSSASSSSSSSSSYSSSISSSLISLFSSSSSSSSSVKPSWLGLSSSSSSTWGAPLFPFLPFTKVMGALLCSTSLSISASSRTPSFSKKGLYVLTSDLIDVEILSKKLKRSSSQPSSLKSFLNFLSPYLPLFLPKRPSKYLISSSSILIFSSSYLYSLSILYFSIYSSFYLFNSSLST